MVSQGFADDDEACSRYHEKIDRCRKSLHSIRYPASPMQSIKRRLSIGTMKTSCTDDAKSKENATVHRGKRSGKTCSQSQLRRSRSSICAETKLALVKEDKCYENKGHQMALLPRHSICQTTALSDATTTEKKPKQTGSRKYSSLAKTLSSIAQLSGRKESIQRNSVLRSSLPAITSKERRDCAANQNVVEHASTFVISESLRSEKKEKGSRLHSQSLCVVSRDSEELSSTESSSSCHSVHAKSLLSPTRYDALDDELSAVGEDSFANHTEYFDQTNEFSSFCDSDISVVEERAPCTRALTEKRLTVDVGQVLLDSQSKETKKASSKWRRITRGQMRMWSQRRNTIENEEAARRTQNMLRVSASGRISLRQKNHTNSENRLSLFGNPTESLLTLMQQPELLQAFRNFLKSEYSEENLDFWLECDQYRRLKPQRRKKVAARIYSTYLDAKAPREINIDAGTRERTERHLENPKENTFDEAQRHIFDLMERDSFRRFITSDKAM